jgi:hypothetical protein
VQTLAAANQKSRLGPVAPSSGITTRPGAYPPPPHHKILEATPSAIPCPSTACGIILSPDSCRKLLSRARRLFQTKFTRLERSAAFIFEHEHPPRSRSSRWRGPYIRRSQPRTRKLLRTCQLPGTRSGSLDIVSFGVRSYLQQGQLIDSFSRRLIGERGWGID